MALYLYAGDERNDPERGKLTLVRNPEAQLSFGESRWYWQTGSGEKVAVTDADMEAIQRTGSRNLRAEYEQQLVEEELDSWGEGARRDFLEDR